MIPVSARFNSSGRRITRAILGALILLAAVLAACAPAPTSLPPEATLTQAPETGTPTPTVVWFPPTSTPTPFPTPVVTPTQALSLPVGEVLLSDDFDEAGVWTLSQSTQASAALGINELTLALHQPDGYLYSLRREPLLGDFYLEITASPNLCRDEDEYGILLRVSPGMDFYRFSLSCNGQARLDKYFQGVASSPQPWVMSGAIPPGAPSRSRLTVWAKGKELRFFVNDEHIFTVQDPSLVTGSLGVFIRSGGENDLTVSFSDLIIRQVIG